MPLTDFDALPDDARLWVFPADRPLTSDESRALTDSVESSLAAWSAHGSPVRWGYRIQYDQVLLIGVDESQTQLTGCSIDSCVTQIRVLETGLGIGFLDNARVFYRDGDALRWEPRPRFKELAEAGEVGRDTIVLNNVIPTVGDYRAGRWEIPAHSSWHGEAFPLRA